MATTSLSCSDGTCNQTPSCTEPSPLQSRFVNSCPPWAAFGILSFAILLWFFELENEIDKFLANSKTVSPEIHRYRAWLGSVAWNWVDSQRTGIGGWTVPPLLMQGVIEKPVMIFLICRQRGPWNGQREFARSENDQTREGVRKEQMTNELSGLIFCALKIKVCNQCKLCTGTRVLE